MEASFRYRWSMKQKDNQSSLATTSALVRDLVASAEVEEKLLEQLKQAVILSDTEAAFQIAVALVGKE